MSCAATCDGTIGFSKWLTKEEAIKTQAALDKAVPGSGWCIHENLAAIGAEMYQDVFEKTLDWFIEWAKANDEELNGSIDYDDGYDGGKLKYEIGNTGKYVEWSCHDVSEDEYQLSEWSDKVLKEELEKRGYKVGREHEFETAREEEKLEEVRDAIEEYLGSVFDEYVFTDFVKENVPYDDLESLADGYETETFSGGLIDYIIPYVRKNLLHKAQDYYVHTLGYTIDL